jgi:predicted CXXCH cytochrome family protein
MRTALLLLLAAGAAQAATYTGSQACQTCHSAVFARWQKTRMANVIRDPQKQPSAVVGDFSKPNPLVTFKITDVAFVYGDKWKQRYFYKKGNDYFVYPVQWDIQNKVWRPYHAAKGTDWWTAHYPDDNSERPTGPLCDGCHSVNYNVATRQVTEWNVGCEKCHGPGSDHVAKPSAANIVNPSRLDRTRANDVCMQCHTQGQPLVNPVAADNNRYYDWPVGFTAGDRLADYWKLEEHKLGETSFTHFPDGTAHKNRMQGNDFVQSQMYKHGITCFACHDVHGTANNADTIKPASALCQTCHTSIDAAAHSHHAKASAGAECTGCHMPKIEQTIANVNVRAHTFKFAPSNCNVCHTDKDAAWTKQNLSKWTNFSPWRFE